MAPDMDTIARTQADAREVVSERLIAAAPSEIFRAIGDPQRLARWWGPEGFRNSFETFDFRPGGEWKFVMHGPDGTDYANRSVFGEIQAPSRVVLEHQSTPHFTLTITLEGEGGGTRLRWRMRFDSAEVRNRVATYCIPANEQNFDRLEAELAAVR